MSPAISLLPLRLAPGQDVRGALEAVLAQQGVAAAFVLQGIGSLSVAQLRLAGAANATALRGDMEILSLAGSLALDGAHLHIALADAQGRVWGGHAMAGCVVRTTAEVLLALLPEHRFTRELDLDTGCRELAIRRASVPSAAANGEAAARVSGPCAVLRK